MEIKFRILWQTCQRIAATPIRKSVRFEQKVQIRAAPSGIALLSGIRISLSPDIREFHAIHIIASLFKTIHIQLTPLPTSYNSFSRLVVVQRIETLV